MLVHWESCLQGLEIPATEPAQTTGTAGQNHYGVRVATRGAELCAPSLTAESPSRGDWVAGPPIVTRRQCRLGRFAAAAPGRRRAGPPAPTLQRHGANCRLRQTAIARGGLNQPGGARSLRAPRPPATGRLDSTQQSESSRLGLDGGPGPAAAASQQQPRAGVRITSARIRTT